MKSLEIIQLFAKIGKIFSKFVQICALVAAILCLAGLVLLSVGAGELLKLGGVTIHSIVSANVGIAQACIAMAGVAILCAGQTVVAKFACDYFTRELQAGTPFTQAGAMELQRLGLLATFVPLGCSALVIVAREIAEQFLSRELTMGWSSEVSLSLGITLLVLSLFCRCGAELMEKAQAESI